MKKQKPLKAKVIWSYPRKFENAKETELSWEGFGVYYISRRFGDKVTKLYVGKTHVQFKGRLDMHEYNWLSDYRGDKIVRFGTITVPKTVTPSIIEDIESALIYEMKPKHNSRKKRNYTCQEVYKISNKGYRGEIPSIIDMNEHL